MRVAPALATTARFSWRSVLLALVIVATAMAGLALLAEAMSGGDGGTVYLANIQPGSDGMTMRPSIVVTGTGRAAAPAESALLQLLVGASDGAYRSGSTSTDTAATGSERAQGVVQPIIDAIVATGVPSEAIRVVASEAFASVFCYAPGCESPIRLDVTIAQPSLDQLNGVIDAAGVAAKGLSLRLQQVGVGYHVADCLGLQRQARTLAIADAKRRAVEQADALGTTLGDLLLSTESASPEEVDKTGCPAPQPGRGLNPYDVTSMVLLMTPPFNPVGQPETVVKVDVSLAYAMVTREKESGE